jgi:lipid A 3-O-deacylase
VRFLLICFLFFVGVLRASDPSLISLGAGIFEALRNNSHRTAEFRAEYQPGVSWYTVRPLVGFMATARGGTYLYGGFTLDWVIKKRLLFSPNFAAGWYRAGGGKNLGFPLEFRSGVMAGWCLKNGCRLGIHFYHISNASLGYKNPGEESLDFFFAFPIP